MDETKDPLRDRAAGAFKVFEYDELDSTNDEAKRLVKEAVIEGQKEPSPLSLPLDGLYGSVVTARRQNAGKGRRGRAFFSPGGDSVYASFILRPPERPAEQLITAFAAVAVCEAIEKTTSCKPGIKWLNDIIVDGKKVCGILAEAVPQAVILGVGVNINLDEDDLPNNLRGTVGSLRMDAETRERFSDMLIESVFRCTQDTTEPSPCVISPRPEHNRTVPLCSSYTAPALMDAYRARSILIGKPVYILREDEKTPATAVGVADDGGLVVQYENGGGATLRSGEVSVRI
ncbi:MAG: biotin--[acetyl-CoA-carboxylase] ligase [Clostridiales bacterium]|nr:biotin--[acetyl-CoA-carboxylase] ligase [Clostridiales bacterium]